jgi:phosphate/sulfate permease
MRLIWKKFDSKFDPVVTVVGIGLALGGLYGIALLRHAFQHPIVLILAAIPALAGVMGILVVVREFQLFRDRDKGW